MCYLYNYKNSLKNGKIVVVLFIPRQIFHNSILKNITINRVQFLVIKLKHGGILNQGIVEVKYTFYVYVSVTVKLQ